MSLERPVLLGDLLHNGLVRRLLSRDFVTGCSTSHRGAALPSYPSHSAGKVYSSLERLAVEWTQKIIDITTRRHIVEQRWQACIRSWGGTDALLCQRQRACASYHVAAPHTGAWLIYCACVLARLDSAMTGMQLQDKDAETRMF